MNSTVCSPCAAARRATSMTARTSLTPADSADSASNRRPVACEISDASVVLPVPGGPVEDAPTPRPTPSTSRRSGEPGAEQVVLADDLVEGGRPHPHRQRASKRRRAPCASARGRFAGDVEQTVGHALCLPRALATSCVTKSISSSTRPMSAGSRSFQSRTRPRIRCHALAMSACCACGQPSASHTPCFQSTPRGTTGHAEMPSRPGLTACQMSMNGWPTTSVCAPPGPRRTASAMRASLEPATRWSTSTPNRRPGPGPELLDDADQIVDAAEVFDDDALDPQVVAPHLLDQLGVVSALDVDPAGQRDLRLGARHRDRAGRGAGARQPAPLAAARSGSPACRRSGSRGRRETVCAGRAGPRVPFARTRCGPRRRRSRSARPRRPCRSRPGSSVDRGLPCGLSARTSEP